MVIEKMKSVTNGCEGRRLSRRNGSKVIDEKKNPLLVVMRTRELRER